MAEGRCPPGMFETGSRDYIGCAPIPGYGGDTGVDEGMEQPPFQQSGKLAGGQLPLNQKVEALVRSQPSNRRLLRHKLRLSNVVLQHPLQERIVRFKSLTIISAPSMHGVVEKAWPLRL